jgi:GT2 family glycosyltransferase
MKASIIIPVWNGREYLPDCLDALLAQEFPHFEVIVVDNASGDGSADFIAEHYPEVQIIRNKHNLGFAGGCNVGLRAARGDVLVLLNQDTRAFPDWLGFLVRDLQKSEIGVVGCKSLYPDDKTIQHAGGWIQWPLALAHHYGQGEQDVGQWDEARPVEYVTGAAIAFRRDVLEHVGFLDEEFWPGYFEDADFCFRIREAGYIVWYNPQAVVVHEETTSIDFEMISQAYQRGRLRFLLKHLSPDRFLEEFVPAEQQYQPDAIRGRESLPLRLAYLEAIPMAIRILRGRSEVNIELIKCIVSALRRLHQRAWEEDWIKTEELVNAISRSLSLGVDASSYDFSLEEFEFRSSIPILGPWVAKLRSAWYSIASRWAVRHLASQQTEINRLQKGIELQQQAYIQSLQKRVEVLSKQTAMLAEEVARLGLQSKIDEE